MFRRLFSIFFHPCQQLSCTIYQNLPLFVPVQLEERQSRIEAYLQKVEYASLEELARDVDASVSTVRRDLSALEATGTVNRTHGGARVANPRSDEFIFSARNTHQLTEKKAIGKACA